MYINVFVVFPRQNFESNGHNLIQDRESANSDERGRRGGYDLVQNSFLFSLINATKRTIPKHLAIVYFSFVSRSPDMSSRQSSERRFTKQKKTLFTGSIRLYISCSSFLSMHRS